MSKAVQLTVIGLALAWWAWHAGSALAVVLLTWSAAAVAVTAVAYTRLVPNPFSKSPDGRLSRWVILLLWPFLALTWVVFHLRFLMSTEDAVSTIRDDLLLGRRLRPWESGSIKGVRAVVDLTCEFTEPASVRYGRAYLNIPVMDGLPPTVDELRLGVAWIREHIASGPVFVHCAAGHARSAAVVAAYLMQMGVAETIPEAVALLEEKRPGVRLRVRELKALSAFASQLPPSESTPRQAAVF